MKEDKCYSCGGKGTYSQMTQRISGRHSETPKVNNYPCNACAGTGLKVSPQPEECICNHGNVETDCFPKIRCACKVHGKFNEPSPQPEVKYNFRENSTCEVCLRGACICPERQTDGSWTPQLEEWESRFDKSELSRKPEYNDKYRDDVKDLLRTEIRKAEESAYEKGLNKMKRIAEQETRKLQEVREIIENRLRELNQTNDISRCYIPHHYELERIKWGAFIEILEALKK